MTEDEAASREASGAPDRASCARCGHMTGGCPRCGYNDDLLGGYVGDSQYCHTFSSTQPSCYTQAMHEATEKMREVAPNLAGTAMDLLATSVLRLNDDMRRSS